MELKEAQEKLDPKSYNELLGLFQLKDLYLKKADFASRSRNPFVQADIELKESFDNLNIVEDLASIDFIYTLRVKAEGNDIFDLNATYTLQYALNKPLPEEFFVIFSHYTLPLQTFPYFREFVHSISLRMAIPSFVLPIRRTMYAKRLEPEKEEAKS